MTHSKCQQRFLTWRTQDSNYHFRTVCGFKSLFFKKTKTEIITVKSSSFSLCPQNTKPPELNPTQSLCNFLFWLWALGTCQFFITYRHHYGVTNKRKTIKLAITSCNTLAVVHDNQSQQGNHVDIKLSKKLASWFSTVQWCGKNTDTCAQRNKTTSSILRQIYIRSK